MTIEIKQLEELSLLHWPALATEYMDGWKLRMTNGYTKRANCISTLHNTSKQLQINIANCEDRYRAIKQPTVFKVTPFSQPSLDETLEKLDYELLDPSLMLQLDLKQLPEQAPILKIDTKNVLAIRIEDHISLRWLQQYCEFNNVDERFIPTMIDMMAAMPGKIQLASCIAEGETVALAMAVLDNEVVGIYDVVTKPSHRSLGLCTYLLWHLLQHCGELQAKYSYLAVVEANEAAKHVYAKLGYSFAYRYWYRVKE